MSELFSKIQSQIEDGTIQLTDRPQEGQSAYQIARLLEAARVHFGIDRKPIVPQYVYNLAKQGQIDGNKGPVTGRRFSDDVVAAFVTKWVARNLKN